MGSSKKKIDTWYYSVDDVLAQEIVKRQPPRDPNEDEDETDEAEEETETVQRIGERKIAVEVYILKETEEDDKTPPYTLNKVEFMVQCRHEELNLKISVEGTDIAALRAEVWNRLDARFEIKWHDYYIVRLVPARIYEGTGEGLEFSYDTVEKGITWEGKELLKQWKHTYRGGDYRITVWPGRFTDRGGEVVACIPRNDMTEKALVEFAGKIVKMRDALKNYLKPEYIMHTLTGIAGLKLLEASNEQAAAEEQDKHERKKTSTHNSNEAG